MDEYKSLSHTRWECKYHVVVCYERSRCSIGRKRCFTKDEGGPLGAGLQEQASNRHKLRGSRTRVVSVVGKGRAGFGQVWVEETNASEPLMTCRKVSRRRRNRGKDFAPGTRLRATCLLLNRRPA